MRPELKKLGNLLRNAAEREIVPGFRKLASRSKTDGSLVTAADLGAQKYIIRELGRLFPGVPVLGEEMAVDEQRALLADADADEGVWCLDPLDGTSNYALGFPYFGVSLALLVGGQAILGAVYDPMRGECFSAVLGEGAWLNDAPLRLASDRVELRDCLAMIDLKRLPEWYLPRLGGSAPYRSQRNLGSVALDWCWLAAGRGQLYLHGGQRLWDFSAGRLIASEAGASSRLFVRAHGNTPAGLTLEPYMAIAAANPELFERWIGWLNLPVEQH